MVKTKGQHSLEYFFSSYNKNTYQKKRKTDNFIWSKGAHENGYCNDHDDEDSNAACSSTSHLGAKKQKPVKAPKPAKTKPKKATLVLPASPTSPPESNHQEDVIIAVTNNAERLDPLEEVMKYIPHDVAKEDIMFAANKAHFTEISRMFDTIKALALIIDLQINDQCIVGECIDKSETVMISIWLERFGFQNYYFNSPGPLTMSLKIEELTIAIKNPYNSGTRNSSTITFFQQISRPDHFGINSITDHAQSSTSRELVKLKVSPTEMIFKNIQLCGAVQVNISILKQALNGMKNEQSSPDVSFTIALQGTDIQKGAPNVDVLPVIKIRSCSEQSLCVTSIRQAQFIVPTTFEISSDQTAALIMKNARWRDGCMPRRRHLQLTHDGTYSLPPFKYTRDILCKISSTQTNDDHVSIFFDRMGSLLFRYNVGLVGAVLFLVTPNMTMDEVEEMQKHNCFGCQDDIGDDSDDSESDNDADDWE